MALALPSRAAVRSPLIPIAAGLFGLAVFVIDAFTPLDIAIAVLYVAVVLMSADFLGRRGVLAVSAICLGLTVLAYLLEHGFAPDNSMLRGFVSLAAIAITTILAVRNLAANETLRKQAELLDLTHDSVFVRDMNDMITYWNHGAEELYGWGAPQAVGKRSHQLVETSFSAPLETITATLLDTGRWEGELTHRRRDGAEVIVMSRWSLQRNDRGKPIAILETNTDITERKRADAELRESERRYRHIFETTGVSIWDEDFSAVKLLVDQFKADRVSDLLRHLADHPELVRQAIGSIRISDVNEATLKLLEAQSKEQVLASIPNLLTPEAEATFARALAAVAAGHASYSDQTSIRTLAGSIRSVLLTLTIPAGSVRWESVLVSLIDVTERNRAQEALQKAQAELAHVARMTTLGELTASIAHEVNQPLAAMVTNGEACLRWLGRNEPDMNEVHGAIERIIRDGKRASDVIWRIRTLSQKRVSEKSPLDLNELIDEVLPLLQRELASQRVSLRLELAPALPPVMGDRIQLQQVFVNLLVNAVQAMAPVTDRPRDLVVRSEVQDGGQVLVRVEDRGVGIGETDPNRIFDAFYTTKQSGMGMGLSICRSIIESHGGRIWAARNAGAGMCVQFTVPPIKSPGA